MIISVVFVIFMLSGGAASAAYASDNDDLYDDYETLCMNTIYNQYAFVENACNDLLRVRDAEAASAVSYGTLLVNVANKYKLVLELNKD